MELADESGIDTRAAECSFAQYKLASGIDQSNLDHHALPNCSQLSMCLAIIFSPDYRPVMAVLESIFSPTSYTLSHAHNSPTIEAPKDEYH